MRHVLERAIMRAVSAYLTYVVDDEPYGETPDDVDDVFDGELDGLDASWWYE